MRLGIEHVLLAGVIGICLGLASAGVPCAMALSEAPAPVIERIYQVEPTHCAQAGCLACGMLLDGVPFYVDEDE